MSGCSNRIKIVFCVKLFFNVDIKCNNKLNLFLTITPRDVHVLGLAGFVMKKKGETNKKILQTHY